MEQHLGNNFSEGAFLGVNDAFADQNYVGISGDQPDFIANCYAAPFETEYHGDFNFSDIMLKYIGDMLMEEDVDEKTCMFQDSAALQVAERSFYEVLGEKYPPLNQPVVPNIEENVESTGKNYFLDHNSCGSSDAVIDENLLANIMYDELLGQAQTEEAKDPPTIVEKHGHGPCPDKSMRKRNPHQRDGNLQGDKSNKQSAKYSEPMALTPEMFDMVLLSNEGESESALRESIQNRASRNARQNSSSKGSSGGKSCDQKRRGKRNAVDLGTLLTLCANSVAVGDLKSSNEFLKQIREHSSPTGDGMQRLAYYFANGLEARLAGSGSEIYKALISLPTSGADALKAYHLYISICPFRTITNFFSNNTIMKVSEKATRLHIVDFGILYGFQWPSLIQRLSARPGGPPKLRITGIDCPRPGFRPSARVEETGRRLANYAETFKVPFEFNAIAQKWDTIKMEDLKIEEGEVLVVNCLFQLRYLLDESVMVDCPSPRDIVLNRVRKIKPDLFIHGIQNGAYGTPFFLARFREALFHFSSLFDMLEANVPREIHERLLIEKAIFGCQAMNTLACEDTERIERPETYKQWQVRNVKAGFKQLSFDEEIVKMAKDRVKSSYHKDFVLEEDGNWLLQGWKGRTLFAVSSWKPAV